MLTGRGDHAGWKCAGSGTAGWERVGPGGGADRWEGPAVGAPGVGVWGRYVRGSSWIVGEEGEYMNSMTAPQTPAGTVL